MSPALPPRHQPGNEPEPRVSVILNMWNGELYLRDTLDSLLAQTYRSWELVVWDDCSTDQSAAIVASYEDPRIRYFSAPEHVLLGEARRQAIEQARGEWLAFLDQDDIWSRDKLERQVAEIDRDAGDDLGLVYTRTRMFGRRGPGRDFDHRHEFGPLPEGDIFEELFISSCFIAISSCMLRTSACRLAGVQLPDFAAASDYYLFVAVAERSRARAVQQVCCWYRKHDHSMSQAPQVRIQVNEDALRIIERWESRIGPALAGQRRRVHQTLIAVEEAFRAFHVKAGIQRLLRDGSTLYLLSRPFARALRALRRMIHPRPASGGVPASVCAGPRVRGQHSKVNGTAAGRLS